MTERTLSLRLHAVLAKLAILFSYGIYLCYWMSERTSRLFAICAPLAVLKSGRDLLGLKQRLGMTERTSCFGAVRSPLTGSKLRRGVLLLLLLLLLLLILLMLLLLLLILMLLWLWPLLLLLGHLLFGMIKWTISSVSAV